MSERNISFVKSSVARFPTLNLLLEEHTKDNLNENLPHVFFGDVTRHVLSLLFAGSSDGLEAQRELRNILGYLENTYSAGDEELQELISVSFLENLPRPSEKGAQIREMVGSNLRRQLHVIG
jgi:hypothetical protein